MQSTDKENPSVLVALTRCLSQILLSTFENKIWIIIFRSCWFSDWDLVTFWFLFPRQGLSAILDTGTLLWSKVSEATTTFLSDFEQILQNSNWNYVNGYFENARGKHKRANKTLIRWRGSQGIAVQCNETWFKRLEFSPSCLLAAPSLLFDSRIVTLVSKSQRLFSHHQQQSSSDLI